MCRCDTATLVLGWFTFLLCLLDVKKKKIAEERVTSPFSGDGASDWMILDSPRALQWWLMEILRNCVRQTVCHCDKYLENQLKGEKTYFGLQFQGFSIHGCLASLFLCPGKVEHHGGSARRSIITHLTIARKQRQWQKGDQGKGTSFEDTSSDLLPSTRPCLLFSTSSQ
jgi:hypothetical protein